MCNKPKFFIFSGSYPYGNAGIFIADELRIAERILPEITIISYSDKENMMHFIPSNASVIRCRKRKIEVVALLKAITKMFLPKTWKEKRFAYKSLGYSKQKFKVNKAILIDYYISVLLEKTIKRLSIPYDAILYSYWMSSAAYFLSNYKKKHPNTTCVCRTHGGDCYIDKFYQPFRREILNSLDAVFPISEAGKKSIETLLVPHVKGKSAPLIVERLGVIKPSEKMNPPNSEKNFCIVTCSNVIVLKRLDLMIDALAIIRDKKIHWIHFGDGDKMHEIQNYAKEKLSNSNINYEFKGRIPKSDILKWYENNHIDLFVNCSDSEGIPVSIMEAFSYGIPAIARDVGGNSEIVSNDNGILLPKQIDAELLSMAISKMISADNKEINDYREAAFKTYLNMYNAEKNHQDFYEKIKWISNQ